MVHAARDVVDRLLRQIRRERIEWHAKAVALRITDTGSPSALIRVICASCSGVSPPNCGMFARHMISPGHRMTRRIERAVEAVRSNEQAVRRIVRDLDVLAPLVIGGERAGSRVMSPSNPNVTDVVSSCTSRDGANCSNNRWYGKLARTPGPATASSIRCTDRRGQIWIVVEDRHAPTRREPERRRQGLHRVVALEHLKERHLVVAEVRT